MFIFRLCSPSPLYDKKHNMGTSSAGIIQIPPMMDVDQHVDAALIGFEKREIAPVELDLYNSVLFEFYS